MLLFFRYCSVFRWSTIEVFIEKSEKTLKNEYGYIRTQKKRLRDIEFFIFPFSFNDMPWFKQYIWLLNGNQDLKGAKGAMDLAR